MTQEKAILAISAPKRLWLKRTDWEKGSIPWDGIAIEYGHDKSNTPFVKRMKYYQKQLARKAGKRDRISREIIHVPIYKGDLKDEQVK